MYKKILSLFLISQFLSCWFQLSAITTTIEDKALLPILTPTFSERQTIKLLLENGLQAYLVSDPLVDKSSAALTVKTGSWEDPAEHPGIAHFLEHMLFLGNKKYPHESEYDKFLTEHGGHFNAFTSNDFTGYVFTVDHSALPEALDRFSCFFKEPLFNPSGVDRELQAINQEYAKNFENDNIREYYIYKEISPPGHPNNGFSMGNRESLQNVTQEELKKWYETHYSANRMRVEVISNLPLNELRTLVIANFSTIPHTGILSSPPEIPTLSEASKGHMIYIEPLKHIRRLVLSWELPFKFAGMRETKPQVPVCQVLGHEGKNSMVDLLKSEKLIEGAECVAERIGGNSLIFILQLNLTEAGVKKVDNVILRCFEAIANLKENGIPDHIIDELRTMTKLNYQYQSREDAFTHIIKEAMLLPNESMETYPEQSLTFQQHDPEAVNELIQFLTPENCIFELMAPSSSTNVSFESREKWLKVPYTIKAISEKKLTEWKNAAPNKKINLPEINPYLPENTEVFSTASSNNSLSSSIPRPSPLFENDYGNIYFAQDFHYAVPTVSCFFEIKTPEIDPADIESFVLADLFVKHASETLNSTLHPASSAGLDFFINRSNNGIIIRIDGYSDKSQILFMNIVSALKDFHPDEKKFKIYKDLILRHYQNNAQDTPLSQAYEVLHSILFKDFFLNKAKATALRKITFDRFHDFCKQLFRKTYVEGMIYGNLKQEQAEEAASHLIAALDSKPYSKKKQPKEEIIVLPKDSGPFFIEAKSKVQGNAAILTLAMDSFSFKERAAQKILMQAMKEPFFSTLRTKQQTGYIVLTKPEELELHLFNVFAVQSNTHDGRDLLARFELFIESFLQEIDKTEVPIERFEKIKRALITSLRQPPQSMTDMASLLYQLAFSYEGDFDRVAEEIKGFEELSYEEFLENARRALGKENKQRLAILFTGSTPEDNLKYQKLCGADKIRQLSSYEAAFGDADDE